MPSDPPHAECRVECRVIVWHVSCGGLGEPVGGGVAQEGDAERASIRLSRSSLPRASASDLIMIIIHNNDDSNQ